LNRLPTAALFGFSAGTTRGEDRFPLSLFRSLSTAQLQFLGSASGLLRSAAFLFGAQCFCLSSRSLSRFTLFTGLFLSLSRR